MQCNKLMGAAVFTDLMMPMIYVLSSASAVIILLYLFINTILVKRLDKYSPAEILKNRE